MPTKTGIFRIWLVSKVPIFSVANLPKFLPQNTKVAGKKFKRQKKIAAESAPKLGQKGQKSGRKKNVGDQCCEGKRRFYFCFVKNSTFPFFSIWGMFLVSFNRS
jgi:hypothetical protein